MTHATTEPVLIQAGGVMLEGDLTVPDIAFGLVLFSQGSGSSRFSKRSRAMATMLNDAGIATFLFDLLAQEEDVGMARRFDIPLLADRLRGATAAARSLARTSHLRLGYFGASTGAAAAITAAAFPPPRLHIDAVVARGGRVDLAGHEALCHLASPTLMVVGENDPVVLALNARATAWMQCEKRLEVIGGASHLFEEAGALDKAGKLAVKWFTRHFGGV